jgi:nuclear GTP-binding protein
LVGYPNTGKSSVINTLRKKKVCTVAPIAGETKVWQYITLMKRIYMIDCPGIVPPVQGDTDEMLLLRGSVRLEKVEYPAQYLDAVLKRVQPKHLARTYEVTEKECADSTTLLEILARRGGKLLKGGEPDLDGCAKIVLNDFLRGKLPWFTPPPMKEDGTAGPVRGEAREGRLGEMSKKRKRDDESDATKSVAADVTAPSNADDAVDDEFEGFSDEDGGLELDVDDDSEAEDEVDDDEEEDAGESDEDDDEDEVVEQELAAISAAVAGAAAAFAGATAAFAAKKAG